MLVACHLGRAQKTPIESEDQLWTRIHLTVPLKNRWVLTTEWDNRIQYNRFRQSMLIGHNRLIYSTPKNKDIIFGITPAFFWQTDRESTYFRTGEFRPFQELVFRQNIIPKFQLNHRLRSEQRFLWTREVPEADFVGRYRYQMGIGYTFLNALSVRCTNEIFFQSGQQIVYNTFDQNRFYLAALFGNAPDQKVEIGYLRIYQQLPSGNVYSGRDVVRVTYFKSWIK